MNFEEAVGKKIINEKTGQIATVSSYAPGPSVRLDDGTSFCINSSVAKGWKLKKKKTLSDKSVVVISDKNVMKVREDKDSMLFKGEDVKQANKEFIAKVDNIIADTKDSEEAPAWHIMQGKVIEAAKEIYGERLV